jgi:phosphoribosylformimino-5-aminoimidazole carboxamide ribotide isomerase
MIKIPAIDLIGGRCVRLFKGDYSRQTTYSEDPVEQALRFKDAGFERLHLIDLEAARDGSGRNRSAIRQVISGCDLPVQVGGGIRSDRDVSELLDYGARYLILGTVAIRSPALVDDWVSRWGGERFIVSIDLRDGRLLTDGWTEESGETIEALMARIARWGMKEVISTDVEKDGTLEHPSYLTYRRLVELGGEGLGVIAAGGVSRPEHIERLAREKVSAAVIGKALYEGEFSWEEMLRAG